MVDERLSILKDGGMSQRDPRQFLEWAEVDGEVRQRWDEGCDLHEQRLREFSDCTDLWQARSRSGGAAGL